jgi:hypothetical protein
VGTLECEHTLLQQPAGAEVGCLAAGCGVVWGGVGRRLWCGGGRDGGYGMGGGGAARTAGNSEELAVEWACVVGAASGDWGSGCADDAVVANAFKSLAWEVVVQRFFQARHGWLGRCWDGGGELLRRAGVRAREGANTASNGHSQELRYSAGEAAGSDAVLLCGRWRGRAGGEAWGFGGAGGRGGLRPAAAHMRGAGGAGVRPGPAGG